MPLKAGTDVHWLSGSLSTAIVDKAGLCQQDGAADGEQADTDSANLREVYLQSLFSSSVIWITSGTSKASWSHLVNMKGIKCPRCKASEDGPCSMKHSMA